MADKINDGGPVYPCAITPSPDDVRAMREAGNFGLISARNLAANHTGMSLRDAAALGALQGTLANPEAMEYLTRQDIAGSGPHFDRLARSCWAVADAFIAAREGETDG